MAKVEVHGHGCQDFWRYRGIGGGALSGSKESLEMSVTKYLEFGPLVIYVEIIGKKVKLGVAYKSCYIFF